jgi:transposase InsO family protein
VEPSLQISTKSGTTSDLASRKMVGWSLADHMRTSLISDALQMAVGLRHPAPGLIFHSDRGSQYTSQEFRGLLRRHEMLQSIRKYTLIALRREIRGWRYRSLIVPAQHP